jgi:hypothetical protein
LRRKCGWGPPGHRSHDRDPHAPAQPSLSSWALRQGLWCRFPAARDDQAVLKPLLPLGLPSDGQTRRMGQLQILAEATIRSTTHRPAVHSDLPVEAATCPLEPEPA